MRKERGMMQAEIKELFDLEHTMAGKYLMEYTYPWEALARLSDAIYEIGNNLSGDDYHKIDQDVWIHATAKVAKSASITGPCIIGAYSEVRHCAYIRGSALVGAHCVVGNSVELKNVILFDHVQTPHYNYVGDSILGHYAHMGAGSITSNVKGDKTLVVIQDGEELYETNRKKVGAFLGDYVEVGCNSVLNPGTIIGRRTSIYPLTSMLGVIGEDCIVKSMKDITPRR
ncbi:MAG: UDP-N-acetylglucosamine pyrophosphorylase [Eubacteriales bacterium]